MKKEYNIEGMSCNHCKMSVEKHLSKLNLKKFKNFDLFPVEIIIDSELFVIEVLELKVWNKIAKNIFSKVFSS